MPSEAHACTCRDCESRAFDDRCKYEMVLRELVALKDDPRRVSRHRAHAMGKLWERARQLAREGASA